jgi:release factor glutamine methyltransferase
VTRPPGDRPVASGTASRQVAADTLGGLLVEGHEQLRQSGSPSPRLDAELLLAHVAGIDRAGLLAHPELTLSPSRVELYRDCLGRREAGEPVAYIRGIKEFYGYAFGVDERALIPRPESELLVEMALARMQAQLTSAPRPAGTPPLLVGDIGTGSGAIVISLAIECRHRRYAADVQLVASDVDVNALGLARENAVAHGVADMISFVAADLLPPTDRPFDLIVANLPYIPSADVPQLPVAASFEPRQALDGGPDGLLIIGRLLSQLPAGLAPGGLALIEIGADQVERIGQLVGANLPDWSLTIARDLAGQPRVAELARQPA